ncbi:MAG: DNA mismatch repair protein MutS [Defluviitaleaceae bacterium]|nr:DNA mismatch repair protein MutS [Defluviitaleaceae bacterium]
MNFSPMMRQYLKIKDSHKEQILFFRLGDFYELFFDDAKVGADVLGLTLTSRETGNGKAPMCGMPHHAADGYIEKLIEAGYSVAVCEQTGDVKDGLVVRQVVQIHTPGTFFSDGSSTNYVMSLCAKDDVFGLSYCDVSTGELAATSFKSLAGLTDEIAKINPAEIVVCPNFKKEYDIGQNTKAILAQAFSHDIAHSLLCKHFNVSSLACFGTMDNAAVCASGGLLEYLHQTQLNSLPHISKISPYSIYTHMQLDKYARRNLEIFETMADKQRAGSLLWVLDATLAPMGKRLLRKWLEQPLIKIDEIKSRQQAIAEYKNNFELQNQVRENLKKITDLERFCAKLAYRRISGRDLLLLEKSLRAVQELFGTSHSPTSSLNSYLFEEADTLDDIFNSINGKILDTVSNNIDEGSIFSVGYDPNLDELKLQQNQLLMKILAYENQLKDNTGIKTLKIARNKVFGYYIEVPNSQKSKVATDFMPRQTLANAQRYTTDTLKELEINILEVSQNIIECELSLFAKLRNDIASKIDRIKQTAHIIAHIDVLQSLGVIAHNNNYVMPNINEDGIIDIKQSRHPVIEQFFDGFVPNDICLNNADQKIAIITGPNMAGKSTYMRQTALCVIMAQIGSFVPAAFANITICDSVLTRVGAADNLARGQSTFMVEMSEVAHIIDNATDQSLILLDEVGRGTGTTDGLAIAMATIEHISKKIGAITLFATHYHELVAAEGKVGGVINLSMEIEKSGEDIKFLWKIVRGGTNKSHGIYVAKMAGLPAELIERSQEIHDKLTMRGVFDEDDADRGVDYAAIQEKIKRYRLFLEEISEMPIDNNEVKRVLQRMRKL